jgi:hypothetical protein
VLSNAVLNLAASAPPSFDPQWGIHPELPPWVLVAGGLVAAAAIFYLYRAQLRIASKKAIVTLTVLRILLVLLVFVVLLGLELTFNYNGEMKGTVWLMLDQSQSMERADEKATPVERLRWADALGLLPDGARTSKGDRNAAKLAVLRNDLLYYQGLTTPQQRVEESEQQARIESMTRGLQKWNTLLTGAADAIEKDPIAGFTLDRPAPARKVGSPPPDARTVAENSERESLRNKATLLQKLRDAGKAVSAGADAIAKRTKPEDAASDIKWDELERTLRLAATVIQEKAGEEDQKIIARNDARINSAIENVSKMSRARLAREVITRKSPGGKGGLDELMTKQNVRLLGFGDEPVPMSPDNADQARTQITSALSATRPAPVTDMSSGFEAISRNIRREPTAVLVVTDGRQNRQETNTADAVRRLRRLNTRIYGLGLGTEVLAPDAAVENLDAPEWVFKDDSIRISALLRLDNLDVPEVTVELHRKKSTETEYTKLDNYTRKVPVEKRASETGGKPISIPAVVTFTEEKDKLPGPGVYDYRVVILPVTDSTGKVIEVVENNVKAARISVRDDKLTILMIEDEPRWEFRYLANYFAREGRVRVQTKLQEPAIIGYDKDPSRNIGDPPKRKPSIDEKDIRQDFQILPGEDIPPPAAGTGDDSAGEHEWFQWQLIVIGDVHPDSIPIWQQRRIVKAVEEGGCTVVFLAGPHSLPQAWGDTTRYPLGTLFPCEPSTDWTTTALQTHMKIGYHVQVTADGEKHLLSQLELNPDVNKRTWTSLEKDPDQAWYWHSTFTQAKKAAKVLWRISDVPGDATPATPAADVKVPTDAELAGRRALLATMDYGLGKVLYLSGDATWRFRQVQGINYHERFWGQVIRWVLDSQLPAGGEFVRFGTDKVRYIGGEDVQVTARIVDKNLKPLRGLKIKVQARALSSTGATDPTAPARVEAEMVDVPNAPGRYQAKLSNLAAGQVEITVHGAQVDPLLNDDPKATQKSLNIEVVKTDNLDLENVNSDLETLNGLANEGGGVMLRALYADILADHLPDLSYPTTMVERIGLFNDPEKERFAKLTHWIFLGLFVALITAEWIVRKASGLV